MAKGAKKKKQDKSPEVPLGKALDSSVSVTSESGLPLTPSVPEEEEPAVGPAESPPDVVPPPVEPPRELSEEPLLSQLIVERYDGGISRGLYEGEGTAWFQGGHTYQGTLAGGLMHGRGSFTWSDGTKYEGDFVMNVPMGQGIYSWLDGSIYDGEVKDGMRHGLGTYTGGIKPVSYIGNWVCGKRHGKGTMYYNREKTSWYQGDWVNNIKEGWGTRRYQSGSIYEGQWQNNVRHGEGTMKWLATHDQYSGQWDNGIQHGQGTHMWFLVRTPDSLYPMRNAYVGEFVQGLRHGFGKFYYANGTLYDGEWRYNKKHGQGKFVFKNGRLFEGEFVEDRMLEFPNFSIDGINTPDISGIRTRSPVEDDDQTVDETHSPFDPMLFRTFLSHIVVLAYHLHHKVVSGPSAVLASCFSKLMEDNVLPKAKHVEGSFFKNHQHTVIAVNYIEKCWEIYRAWCEQSSTTWRKDSIRIRDFMWLLRDLDLFTPELTPKRFVEIIVEDIPSVYNGEYSNLEAEVTFLGFFETLLVCAEVRAPSTGKLEALGSAGSSMTTAVTTEEKTCEGPEPPETGHSILSEQVFGSRLPSASTPEKTAGTHPHVRSSRREKMESNERRSSGCQSASVGTESASGQPEDRGADVLVQSMPALGEGQAPEVPCPSTAEETSETQESELDCWYRQTYDFFIKKLFPTFDYFQLLKREAEESRLRQEALDRIAEEKAEMEAREKALKEAEEAAAAAEEEEEAAMAAVATEEEEKQNLSQEAAEESTQDTQAPVSEVPEEALKSNSDTIKEGDSSGSSSFTHTKSPPGGKKKKK
ncbi:radial spoke head 10 homolog B isoform X4 [Polypterus senegalus]|uniref:radial spoke head 10 homolog B isoform X4 n=1 Tax=Polypterus senegalus TaxID=55291 RepID=UPI0019643C08|nr:radial spoke head 10 homolog B isoform X4 [Polypterus senegalus]